MMSEIGNVAQLRHDPLRATRYDSGEYCNALPSFVKHYGSKWNERSPVKIVAAK